MVKKQNVPPQFSHCINEFCNMVANATQNYAWNKEEMNKLDKLTQDYLHKLELGGLDYKGRAKIATKLTQCRKLRRMSKDTIEVLEPFISFLESDKGKNMMNLMKDALGKTRRVEERMVNRTYRNKVLEPDK